MPKNEKLATVIVSKETIQDAIRAANQIVDGMMSSRADDAEVDQIAEAADRLSKYITKDPNDFAADGVSTLEDYFDDAKMPQVAQQLKADVDLIRSKRETSMPQMTPAQPPAPALQMSASEEKEAGTNDFITNRDEKAEPKTPDRVELSMAGGLKRKAYMEKKSKAAATDELEQPIDTAEPLAPAAPQATMPGVINIRSWSSDSLAAAIKALTGTKEFAQDKAAQASIEQMAMELKDRPIAVEAPKAANDEGVPAGWRSTVRAMQAAKIEDAVHLATELDRLGFPAYRASLILRRKGAEELMSKAASYIANNETMDVQEGGERASEIAQAHGLVDDKTGITRPKTELPGKFAEETKTAGELSINAAVKKAEEFGEKLATLYLDAKALTKANDTRPVREAVEAIFTASKMFEDAVKVLAKQAQAAEEDEKSEKTKLEKKKGSLKGLRVASW